MNEELLTKNLAEIDRQISVYIKQRAQFSWKTKEYVYVIRQYVPAAKSEDQNGPIKIGTSIDPRKRLKQLQTGCAHILDIVCLLPGGHGVEKAIHKLFVNYSMSGEWFRNEPWVMEKIRHLDKKYGGYTVSM